MGNRLFVFILFVFCQVTLFAQVTFPEYSLPLLVIDTEQASIVDEPKVTAVLKIINNGNGVNKPTDPATGYDGKIGIELRGSSSLWFDKKPYGFETRMEDGSNNNVALLGLPEENDWILHAPYSDKSLMRNVLTYQIANEMMDYAPRAVFCELIINGDYKGVYVLLEKIKRDKNRVDISKLRSEDNSGDQLTGGYILKIDKSDDPEGEGFSSNYSAKSGPFKAVNIQYHYPAPDEITEAQQDYIRQYFHAFEDALNVADFSDPAAEFWDYMDVNTFIDYQLLTELSKNPDGYRISTFLYKDRDSVDARFKMGPAWDYNLAMGNVDYCTDAFVQGWVKDFNSFCPNDNWLVPFWWNIMWQDLEYRKALQKRWEELRAGLLADEAVLNSVAALETILGSSVDRNFSRWPILGEYIWPNSFVGNSHEEEMEFLKDWLIKRMEWMDKEIAASISGPTITNFETLVYPNPSELSTAVTIEYEAQKEEIIRLSLFDNIGRLIHEEIQQNPFSGRYQFSIPTANLGKGIYFCGLWYGEELKFSSPIYLH